MGEQVERLTLYKMTMRNAEEREKQEKEEIMKQS